jgi:hypothetical protein
MNENQNEGSHSLSIDIRSLSAGVYYIKVSADNKFLTTNKLIITK